MACNPSQDSDFQIFYQNFQTTLEKEPLFRAFLEEKLFFDSIQLIANQQEIDRILALSKNQLESLKTFEKGRLSEGVHEHFNNAFDFLTLVKQNIEVKKVHEKNLAFYAILPYLKTLEQSKDIQSIGLGMDQIANHFQVAIENLKQPDSEQLESTVSESIAAYEFLSNELMTNILELKPEKAQKKMIFKKVESAKLGVKDFIGFCNSALFEAGNLK